MPRGQAVEAIREDVAPEAAGGTVQIGDEGFGLLFDDAPIGMTLVAPDGRVLRANAAFCAMLGLGTRDLAGRNYADLTHPDDIAASHAAVRSLLAGTAPSHRFEKRYLHRDGSVVWGDITAQLHRDAQGVPRYFITHVLDVSERHRIEDARRADREALQLRTRALEAAANAVIIADARGVIEWVNPAFTALTGYSAAEVVGGKPSILKSGRQSLEFYRQMWSTIRAGSVWRGALVNRRKDGSFYSEEQTITPLRGDDGTVTHFIAVKEDVTQRLEAEAALRASEERFRAIADNITQVFFIFDAGGQCLYVSPAYEQVWGRPVSSCYEGPLAWLRQVHPEDRDVLQRAVRSRLAGAQGIVAEYRVVQPCGAVRWIRSRGYPVVEGGAVVRVVGIAEDITELRAKSDQLVQSQKMEAIGQLAGGVAHDFNNVLTVILSYAEMLGLEFSRDDPRAQDAGEIVAAVKRAQGLTRQLLAFSRQQVLSPVVLDPRQALIGIEKMLRRLIGEHIELSLTHDAGAARIRVDPGQLEQVLMNLAVNARDAMPHGGRLGIATSCVDLDEESAKLHGLASTGRYVVIAVTDTGSGMSPEVRARIFEPFFTTKETGQGTGLGLATAYGIVRQSGGAITVYSEVDKGTVFRVYLPASEEGTVAGPGRVDASLAEGRGETILVVEDDESLRGALTQMLVRHGYMVISARRAEEALARTEAHRGGVQLVLSDVVMPGMDGVELTRKLRQRHPELRLMLMSGYTGDPLQRRGLVESGLPFIDKPFTTAVLLERVRQLLDAPEPVAAD